jgi:hypothetical protein
LIGSRQERKRDALAESQSAAVIASQPILLAKKTTWL